MNTVSAPPLAQGVHTVELGGVTQRYHVAGTGPVCLAHSGGPGMAWEYLRMPAVEEHLTMVYLEPIGTGGSSRLPSHPHGYTRERYAQALDELISHLGVGQVFLLGHSHGGFIAQYYALKRADKLAGVILYESAPVTGPEHFAEAKLNMDEFVRRNADAAGLPEVLAGWEGIGAMKNDEEVTKFARQLLPAYFADYWAREDEFGPFRQGVSGVFISGLGADLVPDAFDDRDVLPSITTPTLVVSGRFDMICGPRWSRELAAGIPGARLAVLEHSGHFGHLEEPEAFARAVTEFVTSTGTSTVTSPMT